MKIANYDETEDKRINDDMAYDMELEGFSEENAQNLGATVKDFLNSYAQKPPEQSTRDWLYEKLTRELPDKTDEEITATVDEIIGDIENYDKSRASLDTACASGISKEDWLADTCKKASAAMSVNEFGNYLSGIDEAIAEGNAAMRNAIMTQEGLVSRNPNLDGFIAEQHHVNTFNMDAALKNSNFRAVRLDRPEGGTFGKNSVDIRIFDKRTGQTVHRYQVKYYQTAKDSIKAVDPSRYGNQQGLVGKGQAKADLVKEVLPEGSKKRITETIGGTDKVDAESTALSKNQAEKYRDNAQHSGRLQDKMSWNRYTTNELIHNIGREAAMAGVYAAGMNTGLTLAVKTLQGEKIDGEEVVKAAITTGADAGVKAATAGALKVGVEKGLVPVLAKTTPVSVITGIACVAIENIKVMKRFGEGELTATQTLDYMGRNTVAMVGSLVAAGKGVAIGKSIGAIVGSVLGPVGTVVGGVVGGVVGAVAGSTVGKAIYEGGKAIVKTAVSVVKSVGGAVSNGVKSAFSTARSFVSSVGSFLGF